MARPQKAAFKLEDVVVSITCPKCKNPQHSPNYPTSHGWDKKDVKKFGAAKQVTCEVCGERFSLPAPLVNMMAAI